MWNCQPTGKSFKANFHFYKAIKNKSMMHILLLTTHEFSQLPPAVLPIILLHTGGSTIEAS
jgi:hypothetical protein